MKRLLLSVLAAIALCFAAPAEARDYPVQLIYVAPTAIVTGSPSIALVSVTDERGHDLNWLGAIRGGYGNPLKVLRTDGGTVSDVVAQNIRAALTARSLAADPAQYRLLVRMTRFHCDQYFPKNAHITLVYRLENVATGTLVYEGTATEDRAGPGMGGGIFTPVEPLRALTESVMSVGIDRMLDDPGLRAALGQPIVASAATNPAPTAPATAAAPATPPAPVAAPATP